MKLLLFGLMLLFASCSKPVSLCGTDAVLKIMPAEPGQQVDPAKYNMAMQSTVAFPVAAEMSGQLKELKDVAVLNIPELICILNEHAATHKAK
jgi:hypothetical protein